MLLTTAQIKELKKPELLQYALSVTDIHSKLDEIIGSKLKEFTTNLAERFKANEREFEEKLTELKQNTKTRFEKLESEVLIVRNANRLLAEEVEKERGITKNRHIELEREAFRTAEYTQYETLEFSKIPTTIPDDKVQDLILQIINSLNNGKRPDLSAHDIQACHRRQGHFTKEKVLCKFVRRGHAYQVLGTRKGLKELALTDIDERLTSDVFINEHLSPYYSKLRYRCKKLWQAKLISSFWVSGHKVKVKVTEASDLKVITHENDFKAMFSSQDLLAAFQEKSETEGK